MSIDGTEDRVVRDLEHHKADIEKILGPDYKKSEYFLQLVNAVERGRPVLSILSDIRKAKTKAEGNV